MEDTPQDLLRRLRVSIDNLDAALIYLLAERFRLTDKVGLLKALHNLPAVDVGREESQFERIRVIAKDAGLDEQISVRLLRQVIHEVVQRHLATARTSRTG